MNKYNVYRDGKVIATYPQEDRVSLKEMINRSKNARKNARLVQIITR